jgi:uncharacterized protein (DUF433 family)
MLAVQNTSNDPAFPEFPRIVRDPAVWGGKAVIAGTRIPVFMLVARIRSGWSEDQVLAEYPTLTPDDVRAAMGYDAKFPMHVESDVQAYERSLLTPLA